MPLKDPRRMIKIYISLFFPSTKTTWTLREININKTIKSGGEKKSELEHCDPREKD